MANSEGQGRHCTTLIFLTLDFEEKPSLREFLTDALDTNRRKELLAMTRGESEIARLMAHIDAETTAAYQGLYGLAWGASRHDIINAKMERIAALKDELTAQLGEEAAINIVLAVLEQVGS